MASRFVHIIFNLFTKSRASFAFPLWYRQLDGCAIEIYGWHWHWRGAVRGPQRPEFNDDYWVDGPCSSSPICCEASDLATAYGVRWNICTTLATTTQHTGHSNCTHFVIIASTHRPSWTLSTTAICPLHIATC